jgi:hypothetical protein
VPAAMRESGRQLTGGIRGGESVVERQGDYRLRERFTPRGANR